MMAFMSPKTFFPLLAISGEVPCNDLSRELWKSDEPILIFQLLGKQPKLSPQFPWFPLPSWKNFVSSRLSSKGGPRISCKLIRLGILTPNKIMSQFRGSYRHSHQTQTCTKSRPNIMRFFFKTSIRRLRLSKNQRTWRILLGSVSLEGREKKKGRKEM